MTTITYATPVALTHTPASLGDGSFDGSLAVDNGTNLYLDALVGGFLTTGTSPTSGEAILIYLYGTWDNGTTYTAGMDGTDGDAPDAGEEDNLVLIKTIVVDGTSDHRYEWGPVSVASAFGGIIPEEWGIVLKNDSGVTLNATAGNHETKYTGIKTAA